MLQKNESELNERIAELKSFVEKVLQEKEETEKIY